MKTPSTVIAKNTLILYLRLSISIVINLYTTRIVMHALDIDGYGIYAVVSSVVMMWEFFNSALLNLYQRFINVAIGKNQNERLADIIASGRILQYGIALIVALLAETVGVWYVRNHLNIPPEMIATATWVYQFIVVGFIVTIISTPYQAIVLSRERMNVFAALSLADVVLRLGIALVLGVFGGNRLLLYAGLLFAATVLIRFAYRTYCRRHFDECRSPLRWNKALLQEMMRFSGWMMLGVAGDRISTHGVTQAINIFFVLAAASARATAQQICAVLQNFASNIILAVQPQIIQSCSSKDYGYMYKLVFLSSKACFVCLFLFALPLCLQTDYVLQLWLERVPEQAAVFTRLGLMEILSGSLCLSLTVVSQASGNIRYFQMIQAVRGGLFLSLTVLFYRLGFPAYTAYLIELALTLLTCLAMLIELNRRMQFPVRQYLIEVGGRLTAMLPLACILPLLWRMLMPVNLVNALISGVICCLSIALAAWLIALNRFEKQYLKKSCTFA